MNKNLKLKYSNIVIICLCSLSIIFQDKTEIAPDRILLKDGKEVVGQIIKRSITGVEVKKEKEIVTIEYERVKKCFFGDSKNELIFDSLLTGNFAKAVVQLTELEASTKRQVIKEDAKFYLAVSYYYQKDYDNFFETLESIIKDNPSSFFLYHILSFIVDLSDVAELGGISAKLTGMVNNIATIMSRQKGQKDKLYEGIGKLMEGFSKELSGSVIEAQDLYKEVSEKYASNEILYTIAEIFIIRGFIKDNKFNEAENKLKKLKDILLKSDNEFLLKNIWSLLADTYRKQSDKDKENRERFLKKALYAYLNVYLLHIPTPEELPEIYAKSMYYGYEILSELVRTAKTEAQKDEYTNKAQSLKNELKQKYGNTRWAEKL